jgi:hypothetical protein
LRTYYEEKKQGIPLAYIFMAMAFIPIILLSLNT